MQTEEAIGSNGGAVVTLTDDGTDDLDGIITPPYPVDSEVNEVNIMTENGSRRFLVTHLFKPLTLPLLVKFARDVVNTTEVRGDGSEVPESNEDDANDNLFDAITTGARVQEVDRLGEPLKDRAVIELSREQALSYTSEEKGKAIRKYRDGQVVVETTVDDSGIGFMFEQDGEMNVTLLVGDRQKPAFKVQLTMQRPDKSQRTSLRKGFSKEERKRKKNRLRISSFTDYAKAVSFFDAHFLAAKNVLVENQAYTDALRDRFLKAFNPHFKTQIAGEMILSFFNDADSL